MRFLLHSDIKPMKKVGVNVGLSFGYKKIGNGKIKRVSTDINILMWSCTFYFSWAKVGKGWKIITA